MNPDFNQSQIDLVLKRIIECMDDKRYLVALNETRSVNINFIDYYRSSKNKRRQILIEFEAEEISKYTQNTKIFFTDKIVYVFAPQNTLFNLLDEEYSKEIQLKYNLFDYFDGTRMLIITFEPIVKKYKYNIHIRK